MATLFKPVKTIYIDAQGRKVAAGTAAPARSASGKRNGTGSIVLMDAGARAAVAGQDGSRRLLAERVRKAERKEANLTDPFELHKKRRLTEHLEDWQAAMLADGCTDKHLHRAHVACGGLSTVASLFS